MQRRTFLRQASVTGLATLITPSGLTQWQRGSALESSLVDSFRNPPDSAKPFALWFWMNGNVTKEGITLDLEAMQRVGIGGVMNFDAGTGIPKGPVVYLSPAWYDLKKHALREAERLGLEFGIHNCPGWSSSGGPWITPELGMQEVTWSETHVTGGQALTVQLPNPLTRLDHYREVAVLAYPSLTGERSLRTLLTGASVNGQAVDVNQLTGEKAEGVVMRPAEGQKTAFLQLEFKEPYPATGLSLLSRVVTAGNAGGPGGFGPRPPFVLEVSDDGVEFRKVADVAAPAATARVAATFPVVTARHFRLSAAEPRYVAQLSFTGASRLDEWPKKTNAAFNWLLTDYADDQTVPAGSVIDPKAIVDLTSSLDHNGVLRWNAPAGNWTILRFGHTALGTQNRSAPDTGIGLECDKYSAAAIDFHFDKMMANLLPALGPLAAKGKFGLEIDSYEVGMQNWTAQFPAEFNRRKGYALTTYLPAMTGRIVGSPDQTNRFLWDVRRTQGDLLADNYYGRFEQLCQQHGITSVVEPYDRGPMEEMQIGSRADINMGEFWNGLSSIFQNNLTMRRTIKLAASIAHVNGRKYVQAEAFTGEPDSSRWQEYPFGLKAVGDKIFAQGLNRILFHRFAHQPHPTAVPGMTMGPWGIHFDRTTTWWESSRPWLTYLARCQSLLQQGLFVADLAYFTGEEANKYTKVNRDDLQPAPPVGYDYDLINAEVLLKPTTVVRGGASAARLVLADGMSYRVLVLQDYRAVSLPVLRRLREWVNAGLVVVGRRPETYLGLPTDRAAADAEFLRLTNDIWGGRPSGVRFAGQQPAEPLDRRVGNGRVFWGQSLTAVLDTLALKPNIDITSRSGDAPVTYIHRTIDDRSAAGSRPTQVYFLANQRRTPEELVCTFRVAGYQPELWDPTTGQTTPVMIYAQEGGLTRLPIQLAPSGSVFVVFRSPAGAGSRRLMGVRGNKDSLLSTQPFATQPRQRYPDVADNFTISLWVKPELNVMLTTRNFMEHVADPWTDYYAIYPPSGGQLYGAGHATCGLTAGRNGVVVWEHADAKPVLTLAAPTPIAGWSHVALVYRDGVPSVYVAGKLIKTGTKGSRPVHPGLGPAYLSEGASFFYGDMTEPQLLPTATDAEQIRQLAAQLPKLDEQWPAVELAALGKPALLIWQDGAYQLRQQTGRETPLTVRGLGQPTVLTGPWQVRFPPNLGAPEQITLPELVSLHTHQQAGVRYFSGTATYAKTLTISAQQLAGGKRLYLDLGRVEVLAQVRVNARDLGISWKRPHRIDITDAVKAGPNALEISVTNLWPNRLIGDEQLPEPDKFTPGGGASGLASLSNGAMIELPRWYREGEPKPNDGRVTFTTWKHYTKDSPLLESGLIGPVTLRMAELKIL